MVRVSSVFCRPHLPFFDHGPKKELIANTDPLLHDSFSELLLAGC